ncbi:MAG: DNA-directed RNA polymerase subunit K [archaeon]
MTQMIDLPQDKYTKYEKARILGARALQISANAPILLKISKEQLLDLNFDPIKIAEMEFDKKILPITVTRPMPKKIKALFVEEEEKEDLISAEEVGEVKPTPKVKKKIEEKELTEELKTDEEVDEEKEDSKEEEPEEEGI